MKNNKNLWKRFKIVLALTFFVISFLSFVLVQAAELPCCHECSPFCGYTAPEEGEGWIDCHDNQKPGEEDCVVNEYDYAACSDCSS